MVLSCVYIFVDIAYRNIRSTTLSTYPINTPYKMPLHPPSQHSPSTTFLPNLSTHYRRMNKERTEQLIRRAYALTRHPLLLRIPTEGT